MDLNGRVQVSASRSIAAPAAKIFQVLANPAKPPGAGRLRHAARNSRPGGGAQPSGRHLHDGDVSIAAR
jgi:hypothetical protein